MPLIIVEGPRKSGKSHLISQQEAFPVFKFDFNESFKTWNFQKNSENVHWFGLGKEVMLHELNTEGLLPKIVVDRGILTNSVWGVFQNRVTEEQAKMDLIKFHKRNLFLSTKIILIEGNYKKERKKDIWDEDDKRREEEYALFSSFSDLLQDLGVQVQTFHNNFDLDSVIRFKTLINRL